MNKKIYFLRHGESVENVKKIRLEDIETPLTENGIIQAQNIAARMSAIDLDIVYSSPYSRAKVTAEKIAQDSDVEVEILDFAYERLYPQEVYNKSKQDQSVKEIIQKFKNIWKESPDENPFGNSESFNHFKERINKIIQKATESPYQNSAFVVHGSILRAVLVHTLMDGQYTAKDFFRLWKKVGYSNTGLSLFEYSQESGMVLKIWNDHSHL